MKTKLKTHKATKKRFKVTKTGKVIHKKQGDNAHLRIKKSRNRKARLSKLDQLGSKGESKKIRNYLNN